LIFKTNQLNRLWLNLPELSFFLFYKNKDQSTATLVATERLSTKKIHLKINSKSIFPEENQKFVFVKNRWLFVKNWKPFVENTTNIF